MNNSLRHIRCPDECFGKRNPNDSLVFVAGGISGCPLWQDDFVKMMMDLKWNGTLINPRRVIYPEDPDWEDDHFQISWEFRHLRISDTVIFWFPCETLCPITLFEYGKMLGQAKDVVVGVHPDYKRRKDIIIQTSLERPSLKIHSNLYGVAEELNNYY